MVTITEKTKGLRQKYKKCFGWTSRQISVRVSSSYGAICVSIHDPSIDRREAYTLAQQYERVQRCEVTGDILQGGNTFVSVDYSRRAIEAVTAEQAERIAQIAQKAQELEPHQWTEAAGVIVRHVGHMICLRKDHSSRDADHWINPDAPRTIAKALLNLRA